jgi:hypothetical protein
MIFCIFGGGKCRPRWGVQRGLPLALLGNFQRYVVLRLGKFPNKLRYFLRKYPAACRLPFGCGCSYHLLTHITPHYPPIGQIQRGGLQPRNDSRPRFPCRIVRGGESPQGIIREDYTRAKRENDGIRVGCFGRQAQQPLESMMIYQHTNMQTYQHISIPTYQHANLSLW